MYVPTKNDSHFGLNGIPTKLDQLSFNSYLTLSILKGFCFFIIICTAMFGNGLVLIAILRFERLRTVQTNTFLVSLAMADLLVALLVMPFSASTSLMNGRWIYGQWFCDIFNANDVLLCTASILHLCCISTERYTAIICPLMYQRKMTRTRVLLMLSFTWILSTLISYVPIFLGIYTTVENLNRSKIDANFCNFVVNPYYAVVSSSTSFWIPGLVMVAIYCRIFIEARRQEKKIRTLIVLPLIQTNHSEDAESFNCASNATNCASPDTNCQYVGSTNRLSSSGFPQVVPTSNTLELTEHLKIKRENKAAKTLGIVMGAFLACWFPFFLWYTSVHICCGQERCGSPSILKEILFWIGYCNSTLNPVIYAYYNRSFRNAFKQILRCFHTTGYSNQSTESSRAPCVSRAVATAAGRNNQNNAELRLRVQE